MALPSNVDFGTVTGRFMLAYQDGNDSGDQQPDGVPAKGYVIFSASPAKLLNQTTVTGAPVTILPASVIANLNTQGYLEGYPGNAGIRLVATNDEDLLPINWTWNVEFRLTDADDVPYPLQGFSFALPKNDTVDLADASPIAEANGVFITKGDKGDTGPAGPANTLTATATTGNPGTSASVTVSGTSPNQALAFVIPRGDKGDKGDTGNTGTAATVSAGSTTTGAAGSSASVTNSGTTSAAVFDFTIPRGDKGEKGDKGDTGDTGPRGEGLTVLGSVPTVGDLPATGNTEADAYIVTANGHLYIWTLGEPDYWLDSGQIQGPPGEGVAPGGVANNFLIKSTSTDYDTEWSNTIEGGTA